jgi:hypothetical protein
VTFFANQSHGLIKTPRYPRSYCGKLNCNWTIAAGASDQVALAAKLASETN